MKFTTSGIFCTRPMYPCQLRKVPPTLREGNREAHPFGSTTQHFTNTTKPFPANFGTTQTPTPNTSQLSHSNQPRYPPSTYTRRSGRGEVVWEHSSGAACSEEVAEGVEDWVWWVFGLGAVDALRQAWLDELPLLVRKVGRMGFSCCVHRGIMPHFSLPVHALSKFQGDYRAWE